MSSIMAIAERIELDLDAVVAANNHGVMISANRAQILTRNAKRLNQLAQDVLDVSRIESNSLKLKKDKVNMNEIIEPLVYDFSRQLDEKGLRLDYRQSRDDILIQVDSGRIAQVLVNLLSNAIKLTPPGRSDYNQC